MQPTQKSKGIDAFLKNGLGVDRNYILQDRCSYCSKPAVDFRDNLSKKEYTISGFCQACQDKVFGE